MRMGVVQLQCDFCEIATILNEFNQNFPSGILRLSRAATPERNPAEQCAS